MVSVRVILVLVVVVVVTLASLGVEAGYRKPPFNGSIFGKRGNTATITDYEVISRALTTMCEVASETCSAWLVHQETN